jgi:hypothetical protein
VVLDVVEVGQHILSQQGAAVQAWLYLLQASLMTKVLDACPINEKNLTMTWGCKTHAPSRIHDLLYALHHSYPLSPVLPEKCPLGAIHPHQADAP